MYVLDLKEIVICVCVSYRDVHILELLFIYLLFIFLR